MAFCAILSSNAYLDNSPVPGHKVGPEVGSGKGSAETWAWASESLIGSAPKKSERLKTPGRHSDGGGLYLAIDEDGRRRWVFMYVRRGRRVELGLGGGRDLSLAVARTEATALRAALANGEDPKAVRAKMSQVPTFGECADAYVETMQSSWRNAKHAAQWTMTLKTYAKPIRKQSGG